MKILPLLAICFGQLVASQLFAQVIDSAEEALLEDLGADLLEPENESKGSALDERLLQELGEDVGEPSPVKDDWLSRVIKHMKTAEDLLVENDQLVRASESQTEALTSLDTMIAELTQRQSQCQGGECKKPGDPKPGQKPKPNGKAGKSPAQSAPSSTQGGGDLSTDLAGAGELVKDLWGKLPERQRQQILQPLSEEFLPKYASEIEAYFRALAQPKPPAAEVR